MFDILTRMFDLDGFVRRWDCGEFDETLGWIHIISDLATFAAYYAVPVIITIHVLKRNDIPYRGVLLFFVGIVFFSCGTVHLVEAGIFWWPVYRFSGILKMLTAIASCGMVAVLIVYVPKALGLRSMAMLANDLQQENLERKRAEQRLRAAHGQLEAIFNSTADAIITFDSDGTIQSFNLAAEHLFGYGADEILGEDVGPLVPALRASHHKHGRELRVGETRRLGGETEVIGHHKSGTDVCLALRVTEVQYSGERQYLATLQDFAERKQAEAERTRLFDAIRETVHHLSTTSEEISAIVAQQSKRAEKQAGTISGTASAIQEATASAEESTRLANEVAQMARRADDVGQSGRDAIDETKVAMNSVREQVESTAHNILTLAEGAQSIGEIITTVNHIAERTNILALNAAIEASRAGESGKGFAVVAAEVKSLAEQAKKATSQVHGILSEIQQATNKAVLSTERGTQSVIESNSVVAKAAETIEQLGIMVGESAQAAVQIVAASTQQAATMKQITNSMNQIDLAAQQQLATNLETEHAAADLNALGNRLKGLI